MLPYYVHHPKKKMEFPPVLATSPSYKEVEMLTGYVKGKKASDLEERAANSHYLLGIPFTFRARIAAFPVPHEQPNDGNGLIPVSGDADTKPNEWYEQYQNETNYAPVRPIIPFEQSMNLPGELEIDLLADRKGKLWPIMIDGQIGHFLTFAQADVDRQKTDAINIALQPYGAHVAVRVPFYLLKTQEMSDAFFTDLYREW